MIQKESSTYPGYYHIPEFHRYVISKTGDVLDTQTGEEVKTYLTSSGYVSVSLLNDQEHLYAGGIHLFLALTFIPKPKKEIIERLIVNHRNGIKADNCLDNLEWTTYRGNVHHAGHMGLTAYCIPFSMRQVDTGKVLKFNSCRECAEKLPELGLSPDAVIYRVKRGPSRVYPERYQYRRGWKDDPWPTVDVDRQLDLFGVSRPVLVRDVRTGTVTRYEKLQDAAKAWGQAVSTVSIWLTSKDQPLHSPGIQVQWALSEKPWRVVNDLDLELSAEFAGRRVVARHAATGDEVVYSSLHQCARAMGLLPSTLRERLKVGPHRVFKDGYSFRYVDPAPFKGRWAMQKCTRSS